MFDMAGFVDSNFSTHVVTIKATGGSYIDGIWVLSESEGVQHGASVQPLNNAERQNLVQGGRRLVDARKIYINDD